MFIDKSYLQSKLLRQFLPEILQTRFLNRSVHLPVRTWFLEVPFLKAGVFIDSGLDSVGCSCSTTILRRQDAIRISWNAFHVRILVYKR